MPRIPFHTPRLKDIPRLKSFFQHFNEEPLGNDCSYTNIFLLQQQYGTRIFLKQNVLYRHYSDNARFCGYGFPLVHDKSQLRTAIKRIEDDASARGMLPNYCLLTDRQREYLTTYIDTQYTFCSYRGDADYIYLGESLADFKGAGLRKKRNRLSHYLRNLEENCSTWNIEPLHRGDFLEVLSIAQAWQEEQENTGLAPTILGRRNSGEFACLRKALRYWRELNLFGIMLRIDGKACGFSIASWSNPSMIDVHYEKCHPNFKKAYPLLINYLSKSTPVHFINREEDLGIAGLRQSKLSYQPHLVIEKYSAFFVGQGGD